MCALSGYCTLNPCDPPWVLSRHGEVFIAPPLADFCLQISTLHEDNSALLKVHSEIFKTVEITLN